MSSIQSEIESTKGKIGTYSEIIQKKEGQIGTVKEQQKVTEALVFGIKSLSKKVDEVIGPKKLEAFNLLKDGRVDPEVFRIFFDTLDTLEVITRSSTQEVEMIKYTRQCEVNFLNSEIAQLKSEIEKQNVRLIELEGAQKKEEVEYVRPDKNANTRGGKASLDLQERKRAWAEKQAENSVIVEDETLLAEEDAPQEEISSQPEEKKKGRKKKLLFF
jgi:hypothetical protein